MTVNLPDLDLDLDRIVEVARSVPGVVEMTGGPLGSASTYLPGRRVPGVRLAEDLVAVHLVVTLDRPLHEVANDVRHALSAALGGRRIDVVIEDVVQEVLPAPAAATAFPEAAP